METNNTEPESIYRGLRKIRAQREWVENNRILFYSLFILIFSSIVFVNIWLWFGLWLIFWAFVLRFTFLKCPRCHKLFHDWKKIVFANDGNHYYLTTQIWRDSNTCAECGLEMKTLPELKTK